MSQIVLEVKDEQIIPALLNTLKEFSGVTIRRRKMSAYEKSKLEAKEGKVTTYSSADEFFNKMKSCTR